MSRKRFHMTQQMRSQILSSIRAGGYPQVAAEAWGMAKAIFDDWLKRGNSSAARNPYRSFARDTREAHSQARLRAEMAVFEAEPRIWLVHGPGRERDDYPGWSVLVKPAEPTRAGGNVLENAEMMLLFHKLLEALQPFPEARSQVAQVLVNAGMQLAA